MVTIMNNSLKLLQAEIFLQLQNEGQIHFANLEMPHGQHHIPTTRSTLKLSTKYGQTTSY